MLKGFKQNIKQKLKETAVEQRREIEGVIAFEQNEHYIFVFGNVDNGLKRFNTTKEELNPLFLGLASDAKLDANKIFDCLLALSLKAFADNMNRMRKGQGIFSQPVMLHNNYYIRIPKSINVQDFKKTAEHAFSRGENLDVVWQPFSNIAFS